MPRQLLFGAMIATALFSTQMFWGATAGQASTPPKDSIDRWISNVQQRSRTHNLGLIISLASDLATTYRVGLTPNGSAHEIARYVAEHKIGSCGTLSVTLIEAAARLGFEARLVNIYNVPKTGLGHTVVEVKKDGHWILVDPTYGSIYTNKKGTLVGLAEIRNTGAHIRRKDIAKGRFPNEYYNTLDAYRDAAPAGPVSPSTLTVFPLKIDLSEGTQIIGKEDASSADLNDPNAGIPAGLSFLGSSYMSRAHEITVSGLTKPATVTLEYAFIGHNPELTVIVETDGKIMTSFRQSSQDEHLKVTLPVKNGTQITVRPANLSPSPSYLFVDYIRGHAN